MVKDTKNGKIKKNILAIFLMEKSMVMEKKYGLMDKYMKGNLKMG